ncbi:hypothetical protein Zmor_002383 [Zophobas morio]|uniref:Odorant receptor n=1 Tax=Zophobas morio TaxID=2755281 RepID=A0AA38MTK7_9CUCU|nr:hypothetical protein Zmor_002383 [Zophobas morio]
MENAGYSFSLNISVMKLIGLYPSDTYQHLHKAYAVTLYLIFMLPPTILGLLRFVFAQELTSFDYNDFMMVEKTQLLVNVWLPDFVMKSRVLYYHVYVILILGLVYASFACGTIDPLIGGLAHQATAQLQVLKDNLENLGRHSKQDFLNLENIDENTKSKNIDLAIKNCIRHHQTIINFVYEYQECFSVVVFSQLSESTLTIGLLCFQISKTLELDIYFLIAMNYLSLLFFQIFFYCYYGTLLIEESKTLPTAVYMSRWYEYNIQTKKTLNILMERSKRPMVVTAGKLFDLSLDTFTTVLKRAYSLVAVLGNY